MKVYIVTQFYEEDSREINEILFVVDTKEKATKKVNKLLKEDRKKYKNESDYIYFGYEYKIEEHEVK